MNDQKTPQALAEESSEGLPPDEVCAGVPGVFCEERDSVKGVRGMENTRILLIAQMKRAIELLETDGIEAPFANEWFAVNKDHSELKSKLREIRRDGIRFIKECNKK